MLSPVCGSWRVQLVRTSSGDDARAPQQANAGQAEKGFLALLRRLWPQ